MAIKNRTLIVASAVLLFATIVVAAWLLFASIAAERQRTAVVELQSAALHLSYALESPDSTQSLLSSAVGLAALMSLIEAHNAVDDPFVDELLAEVYSVSSSTGVSSGIQLLPDGREPLDSLLHYTALKLWPQE